MLFLPALIAAFASSTAAIATSVVISEKINENKKPPEGVDPCFAFWRKSHPCENCVSFKALEAKSKKVKMEFIDSVLY